MSEFNNMDKKVLIPDPRYEHGWNLWKKLSRRQLIGRACAITAAVTLACLLVVFCVQLRSLSCGVILPDVGMQCNVADLNRFDCYPEGGASPDKCGERGCCWKPAGDAVDVDVPYCFYPSDYPGYDVVHTTKTDLGFNCNMTRTISSHYPKDIVTLQLSVMYETENRLHFKIFDPNNSRFEIPQELVKTPTVSKMSDTQNYRVELSEKPFSMKVIRKSNNEVLFDTGAGAFIFADQLIQLSTFLPSTLLYGLGEHMASFLHRVDHWQSFTMWAADQPPFPNANLYGSHPFYMIMENSSMAHGVFLLNSNAMDIILQPTPALTWHILGGIVDMYVLLGPTPADVIRQYMDVIGLPILPPYWALGFHLCRFGYKSANETRTINDKMRDAGIPLDVQWNDIDYMDKHLDFTLDNDKYGNLPDVVDYFHSKGQHYVLILDPGISNQQSPGSYPPYDAGLEADIFVKLNGAVLVGEVWPGKVAFPDFTHPSAQAYWKKLVNDFHDVIAFDGLWLDMNEPSNFVDGSTNGCPADPYESPPYLPSLDGGSLQHKTVCMSADQYYSAHYDLHNLYGHSELLITNKILLELTQKRPFIVGRSTFPSTGHYAHHWLGDNFSTWQYIASSIIGVLNFNMFGIPMVGADICGFNSNTTEDLCQRWQQLGAFYPFSRNHNSDDTIEQAPVVFSEAMINSTKKALNVRYTLLPYLYSLFYQAVTMGDTVARPLFFEFPDDPQTFDVARQFLWGDGLLITPVLDQGHTTVDGYFPNALWYDYYTGILLTDHASMITLDAPMDHINLHLRGGRIIPVQTPAMTTTLSRQLDFGLVVPLNSSQGAFGFLYWDDGESNNTTTTGLYTMLRFTCADNRLLSHVVNSGYSGTDTMRLGYLTILGLDHGPTSLNVNSNPLKFDYDSNAKVLRAVNMSLPFGTDLLFEWN